MNQSNSKIERDLTHDTAPKRMVLAYIGIAIGVLLVVILIVKVAKTNPRDIAGIDTHCRKCGNETNGTACPKCEKKSQAFGI